MLNALATVLLAVLAWIIAPVASAAGAPIAGGLANMELAGVWAGDHHAACVMPRIVARYGHDNKGQRVTSEYASGKLRHTLYITWTPHKVTH